MNDVVRTNENCFVLSELTKLTLPLKASDNSGSTGGAWITYPAGLLSTIVTSSFATELKNWIADRSSSSCKTPASALSLLLCSL